MQSATTSIIKSAISCYYRPNWIQLTVRSQMPQKPGRCRNSTLQVFYKMSGQWINLYSNSTIKVEIWQLLNFLAECQLESEHSPPEILMFNRYTYVLCTYVHTAHMNPIVVLYVLFCFQRELQLVNIA